MAYPPITYGSLTQYFHNAALGRTKGLVTPNQIASALTGMLQRAGGAGGTNPLNQTLGERLAALRAPQNQGYGYGQAYGQGYGSAGGWGAAWTSPYGRGGFSTYA